MKKKLALSLALMFSLGMTGTAFAATEADLEVDMASIRIRIAQLEQSMKVANVATKATKTTKESRLSFDGSDFRLRWVKNGADGGNNTKFEERVRLNMNYKINDDITFNSRWLVMNNNELGKTSAAYNTTDGYKISDANVSMKNFLGTDTVMTMGRFSQDFGATGYWNSNNIGLIDGIKFTTGNKVKVTAGFANFGAYASAVQPTTTVYYYPVLEDTAFINANYAIDKDTTIYGMWIREKTGKLGIAGKAQDSKNFDVRGLGLKTTIGDEVKFLGDYTKNYGMDNKPAGYYLSLRWKEAKANIPGSFGMNLDYRNVKNGNMFSADGSSSNIPVYNYTITSNSSFKSNGFKGLALGASYGIANNVIVDGSQTFKTRDADTGKDLPNYSQLQVTVNF